MLCKQLPGRWQIQVLLFRTFQKSFYSRLVSILQIQKPQIQKDDFRVKVNSHEVSKQQGLGDKPRQIYNPIIKTVVTVHDEKDRDQEEEKCVCRTFFKAEIVIRMGSAMLIAALCTMALSWKISRCPSTDEWIKKLWYVYTIE